MKPRSEWFRYLYLEFNVTQALALVEGRATCDITPSAQWSVLVGIDKEHAKTVDLTKPVLVATILLEGKPTHLLIDGHHRNYRAFMESVDTLQARVLSVAETFEIMNCRVPEMLRKMRKWAREQDYLPKGQQRNGLAFDGVVEKKFVHISMTSDEASTELCKLGSWRIDSVPRAELEKVLELLSCRRCLQLALQSLRGR